MGRSSPPASRRPSGTTGAGRPTQEQKPAASRSARRRMPRRGLLPRLVVLAATLALLVGIFALVRANNTSVPAGSVSGSTATNSTGASTTGLSQGAPDFTLPTLGGGTFHLAGQQGAADLQAFVQSAGIPASAPIQWGIDTTGAIASAYNVQTLETTVVIDRHGQIAYRSDGPIPPDQLAQIVRSLA